MNTEVFPHFIPTYKWIVHKGSNGYEEWCKTILLQDKPGCYLDNVGTQFESCEAELKDFVENSEFCPNLVKMEFRKSLIEKKIPEKKKDDDDAAKDAFNLDELYAET